MKRIRPWTDGGRLVRACWAAAAVMLLTGSVLAEDDPVVDPYQKIAQANRAFAESRFDQALGGYDQAVAALGDSHTLDYNRAAAYYKLGDYAKAAELFARAALSEKKDLTRRSRFGWGNCDYAEALSKLQPANPPADPQGDPQAGQPQDLEGAIERLQSAQRHYRDALSARAGLSEDDPANRAPRGNIERAEGLIEAIQELMQQQQQQQQQQSGDQDQDQQSDDQQQDQPQEQEDGEQEQDQSQPSDQEQDEQQQQQGQQDSESQEEDQAKSSQDQQEQDDSQQDDAQANPQEAQEDQQLGPEEIEAILQSVRDKEKQRREEKRRRLRAKRQPVAEDW